MTLLFFFCLVRGLHYSSSSPEQNTQILRILVRLETRYNSPGSSPCILKIGNSSNSLWSPERVSAKIGTIQQEHKVRVLLITCQGSSG
ncbi:hypothetical protein B0H66DRAFT_94068 [Apodospora peruviana]|uniref:Secreted protein n=1 Tax=Apodospora peruviana TaxID=516989 RepID=A0AAE0IU13_9PEZI|nr:hypothetical protein B0H66DRAFT_94068 [Apodospora peruviana]